MNAMIGPDGQPSRFDGTAWQPFARPSRWPSGLVIVLAIVVVAIVGYIAFSVFRPKPFQGDGVSNTKIDSRTEIEFDYYRGSTCAHLTFEYKFFNRSGQQVDVFHDLTGGRVDGGATHHYDITGDASQPIASSAVRFEADATCHD